MGISYGSQYSHTCTTPRLISTRNVNIIKNQYMAAPYNPPVKNEDFIFVITLGDMANPGLLKSSPTIAAGDFKVSTDGGAFANLGTLPTVTPAAGVGVKVTLSASEMNGDYVLVYWQDQTTPAEWASDSICIVTTSS